MHRALPLITLAFLVAACSEESPTREEEAYAERCDNPVLYQRYDYLQQCAVACEHDSEVGCPQPVPARTTNPRPHALH